MIHVQGTFKSIPLLMLGAILGHSGSAQARTAPLKVEVTLATESSMAGEPLTAILEIFNLSQEPLLVGDLPGNDGGWVSFELRDKEGNRVVQGISPQPRALVRRFGNRPFQLAVGASRRIQLVTGASGVPRKSGQYMLAARIRLSYGVGLGPGTKPFVSDVKIPITVRRADRRRLQGIASELARTIVEGNPIDASTAAESLLSMPESVALPVWEALARDPSRVRSDRSLTYYLSLLNSSAVADLLAQIWIREDMSDRSEGARFSLIEMYQSGSPSLRRHVGRIFLAREGKLPQPKDTSIVIIE